MKLTHPRSFLIGSILAMALVAPIVTLASAQDAPPPAGGGGGAGGGGRPGGAVGAGGAGGQAPNPDEFVNRMMPNDRNGDGKLARDEVQGNFADRLFEQGDADKDGFLTKDELKAMAGRLGGGRGPGGAGGPGGGGQGGPGGAGGEISFRGYMMQTGRAVRGLQRSAFDAASRESDLQGISAVEAGLVGAKLRLPTAPMAPQAQAKFANDENAIRMEMRKTLLKAIGDAIDLENAVIEGDSAKAQACLAKLNEMQDFGHGEFHPPEREGGERGGRGGDGGAGGAGGGAGGRGGAGGAGGGGAD